MRRHLWPYKVTVKIKWDNSYNTPAALNKHIIIIMIIIVIIIIIMVLLLMLTIPGSFHVLLLTVILYSFGGSSSLLELIFPNINFHKHVGRSRGRGYIVNTVIFSPSEGLSRNQPSGHASVFSLLLIVLLLRHICNGLGFW